MGNFNDSMLGERLADFIKNVRDPRIINMAFGLRAPSGVYVDTGFVPNKSTHAVEIDCKYASTFTEVNDGAQNPPETRFYLGVGNSYWKTGYGGGYHDHGIANTERNLHRLTGTGERYVNDELVASFAGSILNQVDSFYLWGKGTYRYDSTIYYGFTAWDGNVPVQELKPIIKGSNMYSKIPAPSNCFWDTVSETYVEPINGELEIVILPEDLEAFAKKLLDEKGTLDGEARIDVEHTTNFAKWTLGQIFNNQQPGDNFRVEVTHAAGMYKQDFAKIYKNQTTYGPDVQHLVVLDKYTLNQVFHNYFLSPTSEFGVNVVHDPKLVQTDV